MGVDAIKQMTKSIFDELEHFKKKYEQAYTYLEGLKNGNIEDLEKSKKGRSTNSQKEIDRQIQGLNIVYKKEHAKHESLLKSIDSAIEKSKEINNQAQKPNFSIEGIQKGLNNLIPFIENIHTESKFFITRISIGSYTLAQQPELKEKGLDYPKGKEKKFLEKELEVAFNELSNRNPDAKLTLAAFNRARGMIDDKGNRTGIEATLSDLKERKKSEWLKPSTLDLKRIAGNNDTIRKYLTDITPDKLHTIPKNVQKLIQGYIGGVSISREAHYKKNEPYNESNLEKLIYEKTGKSREDILYSENLFPNPEGLTNKKVASEIPAEIKKTPEEVKQKIIKKSNNSRSAGKIGTTSPQINSGMTRALVPYTPKNTPSNLSVSSALPSINQVLNQQRGVSPQSSIYPSISSLSPSPITTGMVPYTGLTDRQKAAQKKLRDAMLNTTIPQTTIPAIGKKPRNTKSPKTGSTGDALSFGIGTIIDVRLIEIGDKALKQLEELLLKISTKKIIATTTSLGPITSSGGGGGTRGGGTRGGGTRGGGTRGGGTRGGGGIGGTGGGTGGGIGGTGGGTGGTGGGTGGTGGGSNNSGSNRRRGRNYIPPTIDEPFRKRLKKIYEGSREEITFLYAKVDSFIGIVPGISTALARAKKDALDTLRQGYRAFDIMYRRTGSSWKGMMASINKMFSMSPMTLALAGVTSALIGLVKSAGRLSSKIKEFSAELGTSTNQSYELFKNAMNAQTQYDNLYASMRDIRDAQKGILGDSGIFLKTNDNVISSIASNAKNIGVSTEAAGAFYEALRTKGAGEKEAANLMSASLELADKSKFIIPQSVIEDISQNVEFSAKYFSGINKDSKSAQQHLVDTNLQVKALGLNFQKAAKMTQHLLSFEQSITSEVEASIALGRHVNIGKARELLLQDDIGGAMEQMMNEMGGYDAFMNNMDFAERQLMANAIGLEVSELEKSLYIRDRIGIKDGEALDAAMKHHDYLKKISKGNDDIYKVEAKKVLAAEQFQTKIEQVNVAFKSALLPLLEAMLPIVQALADGVGIIAESIKKTAEVLKIKEFGELLGSGIDKITGNSKTSESQDQIQMGLSGAIMTALMAGSIGAFFKNKGGGSLRKGLGQTVGKARGGFDAITGTLGSKSNPMYVVVLEGGGGGGGLGGNGGLGGGGTGGRFVKGKWRSGEALDRLERIKKIRDAKTPKVGRLAKVSNYLSKIKPANMLKAGGALAIFSAGYDIYDRKKQGQSYTQAIGGTMGGVAGSLVGAKGGALAGAALGGAIGTAVVPVIGSAVGAAVGGTIGGLAGGIAGYYGGTTLADSVFSTSNGLNAAGSISVNNKQNAIGKPIDTAMVDYTPTTFSGLGSNFSSSTQGAGVLKNSTRSVIQNSTSKNVETQALLNQMANYESSKSDDKLIKAHEETQKLFRELMLKQMEPNVAYFTPNSAKPLLNYMRTKNTQ